MQNHVPGKAVGTVSVTKDNYDSTKVGSYTWNGKTYDVTAKEVGGGFCDVGHLRSRGRPLWHGGGAGAPRAPSGQMAHVLIRPQ